MNYLYDGDGRRVSKVGNKLFWYGSGSEILAETDASGNATAEYIFFGGKRIAMLPASGTPIYYVEDLLGTSRVITTNTGVVCYDADFYPYGGERPYTNSCPQNYKFEGKERDTETGNDDFGARYYSNRLGRWLSADWSNVPVPVPYANLTNPQTLNLYAMVADDPESFADLDGHDGWGSEATNGGATIQPGDVEWMRYYSQDHAPPAQQPAVKAAPPQPPKNDPCPCISQNAAVILSNAGKEADVGVKAAMVVTSPQYAFMAGAAVVEAAPAVSTATSQVTTAVNTATTSAYVQATTALSAAGTAISNGATTLANVAGNAYRAASNFALQQAVRIDTLRSGGGALNGARDFVQAATSNRTPPAPNKFGAAGFVLKVVLKIFSQ
jgi:RHS repeat-associated protein